MSILMYKQRHRHPNYRKTPKCNYAHIGYIATRPGAVKNEGMRHGLFGKLAPGEVCTAPLFPSPRKPPQSWALPVMGHGRNILTAIS